MMNRKSYREKAQISVIEALDSLPKILERFEKNCEKSMGLLNLALTRISDLEKLDRNLDYIEMNEIRSGIEKIEQVFP